MSDKHNIHASDKLKTPYNNKKIAFHASPPIESGYRVSHDCCLICEHSFWPIFESTPEQILFGIEDVPDTGAGIMKCKKHCIGWQDGVSGNTKIKKEPCEVLPNFICDDFEKEEK
jgi:hypothetical protein